AERTRRDLLATRMRVPAARSRSIRAFAANAGSESTARGGSMDAVAAERDSQWDAEVRHPASDSGSTKAVGMTPQSWSADHPVNRRERCALAPPLAARATLTKSTEMMTTGLDSSRSLTRR